MLEGRGYSFIKPDRSFMRELRSLDKRLGCFFNPDDEVFVVTYQRASGDPVPIAKCAGRQEDGSFRQPDMRDIGFVASGDRARVSVQEHLNIVANYMEDYRAKKRASARENIRNLTKDDKIQLKNAAARVADGGKHNSDFRVRSKQAPKFGRKLISSPGTVSDTFSKGQ